VRPTYVQITGTPWKDGEDVLFTEPQ